MTSFWGSLSTEKDLWRDSSYLVTDAPNCDSPAFGNIPAAPYSCNVVINRGLGDVQFRDGYLSNWSSRKLFQGTLNAAASSATDMGLGA